MIKNPVQKRSMETRRKIVITARELFAENGFEETNTNMIAKAAGISVGSIYSHFKDKWEIFLIILEEHKEEIFDYGKENLDRILEQNQDVETAIKWIIPGLYKINKLNGKLNNELERFIQVDSRAAAVHEKWEKLEDQQLLRFLNYYSEQLNISDPESAATILNLQLRSIFYYLFNNKENVDEKAVISQFIEMMCNYIK